MSLADTIAAEKLVTIAGKEYKLAPLTLNDYGIVVRFLRDRAYDPRGAARKLAATLPQDEAKAVLADALADYRANVTNLNAENAIDWMLFHGGMEGNAFAIWLTMQRNHAADCPTRDDLYRWLLKSAQRPEGRAEIEAAGKAIAELSGVLEIKNSPPAVEAGAKTTAGQSTGTPGSVD